MTHRPSALAALAPLFAALILSLAACSSDKGDSQPSVSFMDAAAFDTLGGIGGPDVAGDETDSTDAAVADDSGTAASDALDDGANGGDAQDVDAPDSVADGGPAGDSIGQDALTHVTSDAVAPGDGTEPSDVGVGVDEQGAPDGGADTGGACTPASCDDGNPCTVDVCDAAGCTHEPVEECCFTDDDCSAGLLCDDDMCAPACAVATKRHTHVGCEFWATDLDLFDEAGVGAPLDGATNPPDAPWGVLVTNGGAATAILELHSGDSAVELALEALGTPTIQPGTTKAIVLPSLDLTTSGQTGQSVQILSSMPVSVVQANPLGEPGVISSDTSLLLPVHLLGQSYAVAGWESSPALSGAFNFPGQLGTLTIIAVAEGTTQVTVTASAATAAGGVPAVAKGETKAFTLQRFDVLELEAAAPGLLDKNGGDLTGTGVVSSQPVAVFSGHEEAAIALEGAADSCCADHLEEQLLPVPAWGSTFVAAKTHPRGAESDIWRVVAGASGATIVTFPFVPGLDGAVLAPGQWAEGASTGSFVIEATGPVEVAQYTVGGLSVSPQLGDPTLIATAPTTGFAARYDYAAPSGYTESWVTIVRASGQVVLHDGAPINAAAFTPLGDFEVGYLPVTGGQHSLSSATPFGASIYGWTKNASYGHLLGIAPAN